MKKENLEIRSREMQEVMGKVPKWIIRYGISVIFISIVSILIGSYFFKYPEVIESDQFFLSSEPRPEQYFASHDGRITSISINDKEQLIQGQVVMRQLINSQGNQEIEIINFQQGTIHLNKKINKHQYIEKGTLLYTILPDRINTIIGITKIKSQDVSSVKTGQQAIVTLDAYPYLEFGQISGSVRTVSTIPINGFHEIEIELPTPLVSSYDVEFNYEAFQTGHIKIITAKNRLLYKFNPFKKDQN